MLFGDLFYCLNTCGDCGGTTSKGYIEILEFTHFAEFFNFTNSEENYKKKELVTKIIVMVALNVDCGDTKIKVINKEPDNGS